MPLADLLGRGRTQGHLSLSEVRTAFEAAGISASQGRSLLRELTDAGISLTAEDDSATNAKTTPAAPQARPEPEFAPGEPAPAAEDDGSFDVEAVETESADLDDTSTVMGDSVHTYLKSIGRRQLLTAEQEVELAKRIEAGLYAEYKL
jgi:RNA polymerase primary sigma factor